MNRNDLTTKTQRHQVQSLVYFLFLGVLVPWWLSSSDPAFAATHVTATYDVGQNPRIMATVNGQPQYGLVFAQRSKPVTYDNVEYGITVIYGYLDANGELNDGAGNLYLDLIPNLAATPADGYYVVTFNIQGQVHAEIWVVPDQATVTADVCRQAQPPSSTAPALFYQFLQKDGNDLPQRQKLNFAGAGVSCLDNAGQLRTDCTITGGGSGSAPIASATVSGTVKTDQTVSDPVVYLTTSTDSLLAGKADAAHTHAEADVTNLVTDLAGKVPTSRTINTTAPLAGGGALTSNLTLTCATCEVTTSKNQASGYAGLNGSSKISSSQISEVLSSADLTDFAVKSGTGTTIIGATITSPAANQALAWNGSNWINQAQLVTSVFGRDGAVTAQSGDYSASQVSNAFDVTAANTLTNVAAPGTPAAGKTAVWTDSADKNLKAKDDAGAVSVTVQPQACTGSDKVSAISSAGAVTCSTDQTGGAGGGYDTLKGDSGTASKTGTEAVEIQGTVNQVSTAAANGSPDDTVTISLPAQLDFSGKEILGGSTPLKFEGATDNNIYTQIAITDPTSSTKTFTIPDADSVAVQPQTCTGSDKVSAISAAGAVTCSTDETGVGGGDAVSVNSAAATDANLSNSDPAAPANGFNVRWQINTGASPDNISAHLLTTDIGTTTFGSGSAFTWSFNDNAGTSPTIAFNGNGAVTITPGGTNQNLNLSGSGTGIVIANNLYAEETRNGDVVLTGINDSTSGDGAYISTAASGASNYGLKVLTNASINTLAVMANNRVGVGNDTPSTPLDVTGVINASTGYRVNGAATSGRYLRGNGTNFVTSSGAASGTGSCTNQVVTATNDDAAPTCANVSSAMIADGVVASTDLATANKTVTKSIDIFDPTTADTNKIQFYWPAAVTLQRIACSADTGSVSINFDERGEATPNTAGTNTLASALVCDTDSQTTTSFSDSTQAADVPINLQITATSGTPTAVRIHVKAQIN
jgi:hypothetical protein